MTRQKIPGATISELYGRSQGRCEHPDGCEQMATVIHHKARRKGPDPHRLDNLLHVCQPHHIWLHDHPAESYANGSLVRHNGPVTPHIRDAS